MGVSEMGFRILRSYSERSDKSMAKVICRVRLVLSVDVFGGS